MHANSGENNKGHTFRLFTFLRNFQQILFWKNLWLLGPSLAKWEPFGERTENLGSRRPGICINPWGFLLTCVGYFWGLPMTFQCRWFISGALRYNHRSQILICRVYSCRSSKVNVYLLLEAGKQNVMYERFLIRVMLKFCWQTWKLIIVL